MAAMSGYGSNVTRYSVADPIVSTTTATNTRVSQATVHPSPSTGPYVPPVRPSGIRVTHSPIAESSARTVILTRWSSTTPRALTMPPQRGTPSPHVAEPLIPEDDPGLGGAFMGYPVVSTSDSPPLPAPGTGKYLSYVLFPLTY